MHAVQCPHPKSIPEINPITRDYVECLNQRCGPGFSCEFSIHGRGSYVRNNYRFLTGVLNFYRFVVQIHQKKFLNFEKNV